MDKRLHNHNEIADTIIGGFDAVAEKNKMSHNNEAIKAYSAAQSLIALLDIGESLAMIADDLHWFREEKAAETVKLKSITPIPVNDPEVKVMIKGAIDDIMKQIESEEAEEDAAE